MLNQKNAACLILCMRRHTGVTADVSRNWSLSAVRNQNSEETTLFLSLSPKIIRLCIIRGDVSMVRIRFFRKSCAINPAVWRICVDRVFYNF